jgi:hypothetical protein
MPNPSYYFTLLKKFQVLGHVPEGSAHGSAAGAGGFNLNQPGDVFAGSNHGALLGATNMPADSPLWAILNARAMGAGGFAPVNVGGTNWPAMPPGTPPSWTEFQVAAPAPKLVDVFGAWIAAGKVNDIPTAVIAAMPGAIGGLDAGTVPFVCSMPGDNGVRPGAVPANFWATSLIYLVDPGTGATVTPSQLTAVSEYTLAAVIGNRGNVAGGRFASPAGEKLEAAGWVMVWNSGTSPAVELPALSNLDVNSNAGVYEPYFLKAGAYDVVGFRFNVQSAYNGLVAAIGASGADLGGLTPEEWVHAQGAHLCVKVLIRRQSEAWPTMGTTPIMDRRIAQKNLAPFAVDVAVTDPDPDITWRNFMAGDPIQFLIGHGDFGDQAGRHRFILQANLPEGAFRLFLAIPERSYKRWITKDTIKGFKPVSALEAEKLKPPFKECVVLAFDGKEGAIEVPPLGREYLAMSLGIQYRVKMLKPGQEGEIVMRQETAVPHIDPKRKTYEIKREVVGGFTFALDIHDSRQIPAWMKQKK